MFNSNYHILKEEVRNHFNCSELEGAELEDQGEDGTLLTHWEKRAFEVIINYGFLEYSNIFFFYLNRMKP